MLFFEKLLSVVLLVSMLVACNTATPAPTSVPVELPADGRTAFSEFMASEYNLSTSTIVTIRVFNMPLASGVQRWCVIFDPSVTPKNVQGVGQVKWAYVTHDDKGWETSLVLNQETWDFSCKSG